MAGKKLTGKKGCFQSTIRLLFLPITKKNTSTRRKKYQLFIDINKKKSTSPKLTITNHLPNCVFACLVAKGCGCFFLHPSTATQHSISPFHVQNEVLGLWEKICAKYVVHFDLNVEENIGMCNRKACVLYFDISKGKGRNFNSGRGCWVN